MFLDNLLSKMRPKEIAVETEPVVAKKIAAQLTWVGASTEANGVTADETTVATTAMLLDNLFSKMRPREVVVQPDPVVASDYASRDALEEVAYEPAEATTVEAADATGTDSSTDLSGRYRTDAPLDNEGFDFFDRAHFANRIADTIARRLDPSSLVVAVYGPWGDGKTTVLNFIRNRLRTHPSILPVAFNPWRMEGEHALLQGFFMVLCDAIEKDSATKRERAGDVLKRYGVLLKVAPVGWAEGALGAGLSTASMDELKERVGTLLRRANRRVVVLMDDIDRLDKAEIQAIFRLVKLTGDFKNTAYILAFDEKMVATAIGEKYASSYANTYDAGANFLEKIVQVPLHLPPAAPEALRQYCFELVEEVLNESGTQLNPEQVDKFVRHFIDGLEIRLKTPRMAKRYANALHFSLAILKGETHTPDLMLIEGMRIFFPELYDTVRRNPEVVLRTKSRDKADTKLGKFIAVNTAGMSDQERAAAAKLVEALFPRTGTSVFGDDWEAEFARDQRIASEYYFQRYFTYGVNRSDVPDMHLNAFIASLSQQSVTDLSAVLGEMITERNAAKIIFKLRSLEETIEPTAAARLAIAISRIASRFPDPKSLISFHTPLKQAAVLISQLLRKVPPELRGAQSLEVISESETLGFACECARWLSASADSKRDPLLTPAEEEAMRSLLGKMIGKHCSVLPEPIYVLEPRYAGTYLVNWERCSGPTGPRDYLSKQIANNPRSIFELMKCFLSTGGAITMDFSVEADFERDTYNTMIRVIAPEMVADTLRSIYGDRLNNPQFHLPEHEPRELRLAHQFMFIHERAAADQPPTETQVAATGKTGNGAKTPAK
jgi:hypothetical protein